ncbi:hypothetical protein PIB30_067634 [Stylosanthes scabra]|uniref:Uncharacterized protein n=1 Tax=Stylosanthes scabra TaxID=79078 RepID=A0ABU6XMZ0_9FABA|nr:hypothetical protein [Stylosanthes scabra]
MSLSSRFTKSSSKQVMESYYSCNQGYTPWNPAPYQPHDLGYGAYKSNGFGDAYYGHEDPSPPYPPSQNGIEELFQLLCQERKEIWEIQKQIDNQTSPLNQCQIPGDAFLLCLYANEERTHGFLKLSNQWRSIPTLFRCASQKEREDGLLHEEDDESLKQEGMHECLEKVGRRCRSRGGRQR